MKMMPIEKGELSKDAIESIKRGLDDIKKGKTRRLEFVARDYGVKLKRKIL